MFGCIHDPGLALFLSETPSGTAKGRDALEWVTLATALLLATTAMLVAT